MFDDKIDAEFEYYYKKTTDLLMKDVAIPTTSGYSKLAYANVGAMTNEGWELNVNFNDIVKVGKFSMDAYVNVSQNYNEITEMDEKVLNSVNAEWSNENGKYMNRAQVGNPLGSVYGYRYKGVYQYSYDYLLNQQRENNWTSSDFENWINNEFLAKGKTAPVILDKGESANQEGGTPL